MTEDPIVQLRDEGDRHRDERNWLQAAASYQAYLQHRPQDWPILVQLGHCLKEAGDTPGGLARYREAEALAPEDADVKVQIGHALRLLGRHDEAVAHYARALALDPTCEAAEREMAEVWARTRLPAPDAPVEPPAPAPIAEARVEPAPESLPDPPEEPAPAAPLLATWTGSAPTTFTQAQPQPGLLFDLSDVLRPNRVHGPSAALRRAQIEIARAARGASGLFAVVAVAYLPETGAWHPVPPGLLDDLASGAYMSAETGAETAAARRHLADQPPVAFATGQTLVALGMCEALPGHARAVAIARRQHGLRFIPFIHDCLPLLMPELCDPGQVSEQARGFSSLAFAADTILAGSRATRDDLIRLQARMVRPLRQRVEVVRLDAGALAPVPKASTGRLVVQGRTIGRPFVLCAGTIEAREDHPFLFDAWRALALAHGEQAVPLLVCVGRQGWEARKVLDELAQDPALRRMVVLLPELGETETALLHAACLFSVNASRSAGWSLPVIESIRHGRVPLVPAHSGLIEAGGDCAAFYPPGAFGPFYEALRRLILDEAWRETLERDLLAKRRLRSWREVAQQIIDAVGDLGAASADAGPRAFLPLGQVLALQRRDLLRPSLASAVIDTACAGSGWGDPAEEGVPILGSGCRLQLPLAIRPEEAALGPCRLILAIRGSLGRRELRLSWRSQTGVEATTGTTEHLVLQGGRLAATALELALPAGLHRLEVTIDPAEGAGGPGSVTGWLAGLAVVAAGEKLNQRGLVDRLLLMEAAAQDSPA